MADHEIDRRTFLSGSGTALAGLAFAPALVSGAGNADPATPAPDAGAGEPVASPPDISVVAGPDAAASTIKAIEQLGGIQRYVSPGDRVALLMNSYADKPGTFTHPEIALAVGQLCYWAGAKQVVCLKDEDEDYWELHSEYPKHEKLISQLRPADSDRREVPVRGRALEEVNIYEVALDFERLINLPIVKDHSGCRMTGCLKNMMGLTSLGTNIGFHLGDSPISTGIANIGNAFPLPDHFAQCLADLYTVRRPDLCVLDATEFIVTNGPSGPGKIKRAGEVIAGSDPVAIDALASAHLGLDPEEVFILSKAAECGVGELDPGKRRILRTELG